MKEKIYERGITLIALVITIVVLLILAGVTLSIVFNGEIIDKSQDAVIAYDKESAREKLQIELVAMLGEKVSNKEYNSGNYLTTRLSQDGFGVSGDVVIVDGWQFLIDRNIPQIIGFIGKGEIEDSIEIELSKEDSKDNSYVFNNVTIAIKSSNGIKTLYIDGKEITDYEETGDGEYTLSVKVEENKTLSVLVTDNNENYNINSIEILDLAEDMNISNSADFMKFLNKMAEGATFEGKTITLMSDIEFNTGKYRIVDDLITFDEDAEKFTINTGTFQGTLNGNFNTIKGIYLYNVQGIFTQIGTNGVVENLKILGKLETNVIEVGMITGYNYGIIEKCGIEENGYVYSSTENRSSSSNSRVGGIAGANYNLISECYNKSNVDCKGPGNGGIAGANGNDKYNAIIQYCYNTGDITANSKTQSGYNNVAGIVGAAFSSIEYCYNIGTIVSSGNQSSTGTGLVAGQLYSDHRNTKASYCYASNFTSFNIIGVKESGTSSVGCSKVSDDLMKSLDANTFNAEFLKYFKTDTKNINNGYPILEWE